MMTLLSKIHHATQCLNPVLLLRTEEDTHHWNTDSCWHANPQAQWVIQELARTMRKNYPKSRYLDSATAKELFPIRGYKTKKFHILLKAKKVSKQWKMDTTVWKRTHSHLNNLVYIITCYAISSEASFMYWWTGNSL